LIKDPIVSSSPPDGIVLDPFMGSGTTAIVALENDRRYLGYELNEDYLNLANERIAKTIS
jgi:site-specific DNA-methyltransferase (adenine-specific)